MSRIAYVINYIVKNGPSSVVLNLIYNLDRSKFDITLITLFSGENDAEVVKKLSNYGVSIYECNSLTRMKCLLGKSAEFENLIKDGQFDILHTHGLIPDILSARLKCATKKITTIHNNMYEDYLDSYGYAKSRIFIALHLKALMKLDECICCSESVYHVMKQKLRNVSFIRNSIEPVKAHSVIARENLGIPNNARVFLYAGVLNSRKNIVWFIENFVKYHTEDEYLLILGTGNKESECKVKADDHVKMLGFQNDPIAYMNISDIYASASKSEGFSISVLEALSCGLGLFLSDIPSHREVVEMEKDEYVGEIFNSVNFADKLDLLRKKHFDRNSIVALQRRELAASVMSLAYLKEYEKILL